MISRIERLERLNELRGMGAITDAEFVAQKAKLIGADQRVERLDAPTEAPSFVEDRGPKQDRFLDEAASIQMVEENRNGLSLNDEALVGRESAQNSIVNKAVQPAKMDSIVPDAPDRAASLIDRFIDRFPSWASLPDVGKVVVVLGGFIALWIMWLTLKYLGIVLGLGLLVYSAKEVIASRLITSEPEELVRKKVELRANNLIYLFWFAIIIVIISSVIDYFAFSFRKRETEIAQAQYPVLCKVKTTLIPLVKASLSFGTAQLRASGRTMFGRRSAMILQSTSKTLIYLNSKLLQGRGYG